MKKLLYILLFVPLALFGQDNYSLSFDGENDYVNLGNNSLLPTNSVTFGFRIKNNFGDFEIITSDISYTTYTVRIENGELYFRIFPIAGGGAYGQIITHPIMSGEWQYVFCTWDGNDMKIYINDSLMNTGILVADSVSFTESDIFLGTYPTFPDDSFFSGKIDEVIILNYAITQEEIQSYITCAPTGDEEGLIGYWNFNEGSGDTVYDLSGNGNHGIINGATFSEDVPEQNCEVSQSDGLVLAEALTEGLIAYYPFNENANDESGNGHNGEVRGALLTSDRFGNSNSAYSFQYNGNNEIFIPYSNDLNSEQLSVSIWVYANDFCWDGNSICGSTIIGRNQFGYSNPMGEHWGISFNDTDIGFGISTNQYGIGESVSSETPIDLNEWVHIVTTYNNQYLSLYVNGELINQTSYSGELNQDGLSGISIGISNQANGYWYPLSGKIDDVGIWGRSLSYQEIDLLYNGTIIGCTDSLAINFNSSATEDDGSCIQVINGCTDSLAINYNYQANNDDDSCISQEEYTIDSLNNVVGQATTSISSLQQALDTWNTTIDLSAGWNMFGYGCPSSIDVAEGLSNHTPSIIITKDNSGNVYMPEFGFNSIGDFTPGFGYQIKLTEAVEGFSLCDWYVNDIPEDNIVSLQEENAVLQNELKCYQNPEIGDLCFGGIVFYIDESGKHGLIAGQEDLTNRYSWGCNGQIISDASGLSLGTGMSNSIAILEDCNETNTAAEMCLNAHIEGYSDWFLPSKDELTLLYQNIGPESIFSEITSFDSGLTAYYWSSSEGNSGLAWHVFFGNGTSNGTIKSYLGIVRPIRSF